MSTSDSDEWYNEDDSTPMYKVDFIICSQKGEQKIVESYLFDDLEDAQLCRDQLTRQRICDTYKRALKKYHFEVLKRRHFEEPELNEYKRQCEVELDINYPRNAWQPSYKWGATSFNWIVGPSYEVKLTTHNFYLRYNSSIITSRIF